MANQNAHRGDEERKAIQESTEALGDEEKKVSGGGIVKELSEIKQLKADCIEDPNNKELADELERRSDAVKSQIGALMADDLEKVQDLMARAYREAAFDPIDLIELGFDDEIKDKLSEKM